MALHGSPLTARAPLVASLALCATAAVLAVVSLSTHRQRGAADLESLRSSGQWPNSAPGYEPRVGALLSKQAVRGYHPRRPWGKGIAASAEAGEPLVTARTEREVIFAPLLAACLLQVHLNPHKACCASDHLRSAEVF